MPKTSMWNPRYEQMSRDRIEALQSDRVQEQVKHVYRNADFYTELYDEAGVHPSDIRDVSDLSKLPTMDKDDLRDYRDRTGDFFCGALCVPEPELEFVTRSTGTSGNPNWFGVTEEDLEKIAEHFARQWWAFGLRKGDRVSIGGSLQWHGYVEGMERGAAKIGAVPIRTIDTGRNGFRDMDQQLSQADLDVGSGYQPELEAQYMEETGFDPQETFPHVRFASSGVDMTEPKREFWEETWGVPFYNGYGSGDQFWTTYNCSEDFDRHHVIEDHFVFEVLDPETDEPVDDGEWGLLHVTNLRDTANPYIRYNMEDLVVPTTEVCECGRTTMRIEPLGRESWSVHVEGRDRPVTSIEVEEAVWQFDDLFLKKYQMVEETPGVQSRLHVRIATDESVPESVREDAEAALEEKFGVPAALSIVSPDEIGLESAIKMERVAEEHGS